jgi:hypothetical protein
MAGDEPDIKDATIDEFWCRTNKHKQQWVKKISRLRLDLHYTVIGFGC